MEFLFSLWFHSIPLTIFSGHILCSIRKFMQVLIFVLSHKTHQIAGVCEISGKNINRMSGFHLRSKSFGIPDHSLWFMGSHPWLANSYYSYYDRQFQIFVRRPGLYNYGWHYYNNNKGFEFRTSDFFKASDRIRVWTYRSHNKNHRICKFCDIFSFSQPVTKSRNNNFVLVTRKKHFDNIICWLCISKHCPDSWQCFWMTFRINIWKNLDPIFNFNPTVRR